MAAALRAVADVLRGGRPSPDGGEELLVPLESVAAMLALGADADTAWRVADVEKDLAPLAAAARRSAVGGTTLADAVREHGRQLREEARHEASRSAGRAGVAMTAPLGACFLPAFLCLGLAPVVLGLLARMSIF
jgi:pilus assembly protein TadC